MFNFPLFPDAASTLARGVDLYYFFLIAVSVFFTVLIYFLCAYFGVKYRRRHPDEVPAKPLKESLFLELIWAGVPFVLVMIMFVWSAVIYFQAYYPPEGAMEMYVVGKQWMWKVQHPEGHREINEMHVPVGRPVKLTMTTEDVLHSYFIPAFRIKKDVVPGKYTTMWFEASKPGKYHLFCAEYCGNQHSGMIGSVHVMEQADYEAWLAGVQRGETMAQAGERLFSRLGCASCHKEDNTGRCPTLKDVFGKPVLLHNGQRVVADEAYMRESILKPNAKIVAGYTQIEMPTFQGQISEDGVLQVIAYLKTLSKPEPKQQAAAAPAAAAKGGKK
ncbi:MAG: cytochrome c oxidase subunit II [Bryobacteraceae bacterium]